MGLKDSPAFRGEYAFLSNMYPAKVMMYGKEYPTTEHAFQAAKCANPEDREKIRTAITPGIAKKRGNEVKAREDWDVFRLMAMKKLLDRKFAIPELREKLLATGDEELVEYNPWHDNFWGHCSCNSCSKRGHGNHLGRMLMKIREEIRNHVS